MDIKRAVKKLVVFIVMAALLLSSVSITPDRAEAVVRLNRRSVRLVRGKKVRLRLKGARASRVRWSSSNRKRVTVTKNGLVRARAKGKAVVTAVYRGRRYRCRVTVIIKKKNSSGSSSSGSKDNSGNGSKSSSKNGNSSGSSGNSDSNKSSSKDHSESSTGEISGTAVHTLPSNVSENTLAVGGMTVTLDEDINTVKQRLGTEVRSYKEPQGFTAYEYNPGGDYSNLLFVFEDGGKVAGMQTISPYADYSGIVHSGQAAANAGDSVKADTQFIQRFKQESTYNNSSEYSASYGGATVEAYAGVYAIAGNTNVFGIRVYKSTYDSKKMHLASSNTYDSSNMTAASYDGKSLFASTSLAYEICDLLSAYRVCEGKTALQAELVDTIGLEMAEKLAAGGTDRISQADMEAMWQKAVEASNGESGVESTAKAFTSKSISSDPMGAVTAFTQFDASNGGSGNALINGDYDRVTAGFVYNPSDTAETYAAFFIWKVRVGLLDD